MRTITSLTLVAAAALAVSPPRESAAAVPGTGLGPVLMLPSVMAPSLPAILAEVPLVVALAKVVESLGPAIPEFLVEQLGTWRTRMAGLVTGLANRVAALATYAPPNLASLTTEPIASSNFFEESSGYGWRNDPIRHFPKFHSGTDFRGKRGTPVLAAGAGAVIFAGRQHGYGNLVIVDHGDGLTTRYAHLRKITAKKLMALTAGAQVGELGATGRATGPHLHFEVRVAGRPVDPVAAMTIANLQRTSPTMGNIAAYALAPELQRQAASRIDPPKRGQHAKAREGRPERSGRAKRVRPVS